jgi:hypothetical protein
MTTDKELTYTEVQELLGKQYCYFCGAVITRTYVGVVFDANHDDNGNPRPQILNENGTQHLCAARQACKSYYREEDFN